MRTHVKAIILFATLVPELLVGQTLSPAPPDAAQSAREVAELRALLQNLQARFDALESRLQSVPPANMQPEINAKATTPAPQVAAPALAENHSGTDVLNGTTLNLFLDGYYSFNFNAPIGRTNLLRAYDVSSNSFSLNQAALVIENAPDPAHGKRLGARLDLQWGQATQTLQGNAANEPRPEIYRNVFQAYGTYVAPLGGGLTLDFGKWASSLGFEANYTKDQNNYSRSYWFNFLPFYHMGVRANYKVNDKLSLNYWIVNGTQQTEAFNGFKDQLFGLNILPTKKINWTVNYYLGQEHPDTTYYPNGAPLNLGLNVPTIQGTPFAPIPNAPNGRLHIFDSYAGWNASPKLTLALEGDYVLQRLFKYSAPAHTIGGAVYARYQLPRNFAIAGRAEYLSDRGGLFSGATQALKETTLTTEYKFDDQFVVRAEWRRDFSNQPYFLTNALGVLRKEQNTATLGLVWWYGRKQGAW